jgi:hypothetical protein
MSVNDWLQLQHQKIFRAYVICRFAYAKFDMRSSNGLSVTAMLNTDFSRPPRCLFHKYVS